jgi:hypothetical protein
MRNEIKADIQSVIDNFSIINEWCKESADILKRTCELYKYDKQKLQSILPTLYIYRGYCSVKNEVATMRQIDDLIKNYFE